MVLRIADNGRGLPVGEKVCDKGADFSATSSVVGIAAEGCSATNLGVETGKTSRFIVCASSIGISMWTEGPMKDMMLG